MKKYFLVSQLLIICGLSLAQTNHNYILKKLEGVDTLYLSFCISSGEFASTHKGILLYQRAGEVHGKFVLYKFGILRMRNKVIEIDPKTIPIALIADSIGSFYLKNKLDYFILKDDWILSKEQLGFVDKYLKELEAFTPRGDSNAPDYYAIVSNDSVFLKIDTAGTWNRLSKLRRELGFDENVKRATKPNR